MVVAIQTTLRSLYPPHDIHHNVDAGLVIVTLFPFYLDVCGDLGWRHGQQRGPFFAEDIY